MTLLRKHFFKGPDEFFKVVFIPNNEWDLATDLYEKKDALVAEIHVPGIDKDKMEISVEGDRLKVTGSREEKREVKEGDYYKREVSFGEFERIITLPCAVDQEKIAATYKDGVLTVTLPKKETETLKKIKVS